MRVLKYGAVALVALIIGVIIGSAGNTSDSGDTAVKTPTSTPGGTPNAPTPEESTPEPIQADPEAKQNLKCAYVLGDFGDSGDPAKGFRFIGGGNIKNTGNVGIIAQATFKWGQLGQAPITQRRKVRLKVGESKRLSVTVPASQDEIDLHQSGDSDCSARVKITDTFGTPQP